VSFLWIPVTLLASLLQALRTADQRRLVGEIGNNGANLARYAVGAPLAVVAFVIVSAIDTLPMPGLDFLVHCLSAGAAQIVATALLLYAIRTGFVVGTTLAKTEALQAALFSALVLGEYMSWTGWTAVALAFVGVVLLSGGVEAMKGPIWRDRAALAGLASAAVFAVSAVSIRAAAFALPEGGLLTRAVMTLATTTCLQVIMMVLPMALLGDRGLRGLFRSWLLTLRVGLLSITGSLGWYFAFTLAPVAFVRALGQSELIFTVFLAKLRFGERLGMRELMGVALVGGGVVLLLLSSKF
jgi:drug/metabolite transporter (DMT)-like permease